MSGIRFNSEAEFEVAIAERVAAEVAKAKAELASKPAKEPKGYDWSTYDVFPDLVSSLKATNLRPTGFPASCVYEVWRGATSASAIAKIITETPKGEPTNALIIGKALATAEAAFLLANTGIGIKVETKRGNRVSGAGDSFVRVMKFHPWREEFEDKAAEEQLAA